MADKKRMTKEDAARIQSYLTRQARTRTSRLGPSVLRIRKRNEEKERRT